MNDIHFLGVAWAPWITIPVIFLTWVTLLFSAKVIIFRTIHRVTQKTKIRLDDILVKALDFPLTLLIWTSGGAVVERVLPVATNTPTEYFLIAFKAVTIIAIVLFVDKFLNGLLDEYSGRVEILRTSGSIAKGFIRVVVIGLGLLILLDSFGVSVTPVLASLGIGSLAVALALQSTLENFFSGLQIVIDKPIKIGQFIKLESGEEGYVSRIGWRSTWIRMLADNTVVMPNKAIINSRIVNYYYPDKETAVLVEVGVHYHSDLEHVERVTTEVARETLQSVQGAVRNFEPFIRYHTFASSSVNFTVILRAAEIVDQYVIKHEFIKRLHKRYAQEAITIPLLVQALNLEQEKADFRLKTEDQRPGT